MSTNMDKDPLESMDLTVAFSTGKINSSRQMRLLMFKDDVNLFDIISKMDTGQSFDSFDSSCFNEAFRHQCSQTFNQIKAKHKSINYKRDFQRKMMEKNYFVRFKRSKLHYIIPKKCQYQVHPAQIQEGIRRICYKLLPPKIIGNQRNIKKILKALQNFLNTAKTEPFNLLNLVKSLNFESIIWIQLIDNERYKRILIAKFIKWLFQFFVAVIEKIFYISHIQGVKVFIFIEDWEKQKNDRLKLLSQKSALQLIGPVTELTETKNRLCFIPKRDTLRPITIHKYDKQNYSDNTFYQYSLFIKIISIVDEEKQLLKQIIALLKYLYQTNYQRENKLFNETLIEIFKNYNDDNNRILVVSCDINDAYGSILQGKLFDIVQKMFQTLPTNVKFKYKIVRNVKQYQLITDDTNVLSYDLRKCEIVDKQLLLRALKNYIFQTQVIYKNKVYNINRGITQGLMVSGILCSIYYAHMNVKHFAAFKRNGDLFNYVDDYLYVTNQLVFAKQSYRFLQKVQNGISEYNCHFKKSKLKHNLESQDSQCISYLGWKFDFQSSKIEPKYNSTRHSIYFNSLNTKSFEFKLKRLASLKLNKLILTKKITSSKNIFENIALICRRQAERCFALLSCLYDTRQENVDTKSITKINYYVLRKIENLTEWNTCEKTKNRTILKYIIWSSFFNIFRRRYHTFSSLTIEFKALMKKYKKKSMAKLNNFKE